MTTFPINSDKPLCIVDNSVTPTRNILCVDVNGVDNSSSFRAPIRAVTASANATASDYTILCNATAAGFSVVPTNPIDKQILNIKKIDTTINTVTVSADIDADGFKQINTPWDGITIQYSGARERWFIL